MRAWLEKMVPNYSRLVMKFKKDLQHDGLWENEFSSLKAPGSRMHKTHEIEAER